MRPVFEMESDKTQVLPLRLLPGESYGLNADAAIVVASMEARPALRRAVVAENALGGVRGLLMMCEREIEVCPFCNGDLVVGEDDGRYADHEPDCELAEELRWEAK